MIYRRRSLAALALDTFTAGTVVLDRHGRAWQYDGRRWERTGGDWLAPAELAYLAPIREMRAT